MMLSNQVVEKKDRRDGKGRVIALSRRVFRIIGSDVFYVESETVDGRVYFIMFNTAKEYEWCSCLDNSTRRVKCKHIFAVEYAIKFNTLKDTDKLPQDMKKDNTIEPKDQLSSSLSWKKDEYSF